MDNSIFKGVPTLETERLIIKAISIEDVESIYNQMTDKKVRKYFEKFWPKDREGIEKFVESAVQKNKDDLSAEWVIFSKADEKVIGRIWLAAFLPWCRSVIVGYCLEPDYWGKGITSEALKRVISFGFEDMKLKRIEAWHDTANIASGKVMQKCGLTHEGTLRQRGDSGDAEMYSILIGEYQK